MTPIVVEFKVAATPEHAFADPEEATDVEVTFAAGGDGTNVRIEQRGWERLGATGAERRTNTDRAWSAIVPESVTVFDAASGELR